MNIWTKIAIEVVLVVALCLIARVHWVLWRQPHYFKDALMQRWAIEQTIGGIEGTINESILSPEYEMMEKSFPRSDDTSVYPVVLSSYCEAAFKTWRKVRLRFFAVFLAILIGSMFMSWVFGPINLLVFLLFKAKALSPNSGSSLGDVVRTVGMVTMVIQRWWKVDPAGCRRFCTELSPQFATVFAVVSATGSTIA